MRLVLAAAALLSTVNAVPALDLANYRCTVTDFVDDSRYPADDAFAEQQLRMVVHVIDAGNNLSLETTLPNEQGERVLLPVLGREDGKLVAEVRGETWEHSVMLNVLERPVAGLLIYRTYEIDHRWSLRCE